MKKKYLWIGGGLAIAVVIGGITVISGKKEELQEVQTAQVRLQKSCKRSMRQVGFSPKPR